MVKTVPYIVLFFLMTTSLKASVIALADSHQIHFDQLQWEYVLSEDTFQKSLGLLESKTNEHIKGIIDTEVRITSPQKTQEATDLLKEECLKLKAFWDASTHDVRLENNRYCLIEQKAGTDDLMMTQVLEAKRSSSNPGMFFVYTWTFHTQKEHLRELRALVQTLREGQP